MLKIMRQGQRWIMAFVIVLVGGAFVFFLGQGGSLLGGNSTGDAVVRVGERRFDARAFLRVRANQENRYRELLGDDFDARAASDQLDMSAANLLVQTAILASEAEALGLRVSKQEIRDYIQRVPAFQNDSGRFDREAFRSYVQYEYGTERSFVESIRRDLLVQKVLDLISGGVGVSDGEVRGAVRYEREQVRIAFVTIDPKQPPPDLELEEAAVQAFLLANEERVRGAYASRSERYDRPEQVRARHILVRVAPDAGPEAEQEARRKAETLRQQLLEGADFAELARQSDDEGSRERGGDLGFFPRGAMVKPFEEAAFALPPGEVSEPLRTPFGFHLIRVEERREAKVVPLEDVREEIARELLGEQAAARHADELSERLLAAIRDGSSLEQAARTHGLTLERTGLLHRRPDGYLPELGTASEVLTAAFTLREEAPTPAEVFEVGGKRVLIQLLERREPTEQELDQALEAVREQLLEQKRLRLQTAWIEQRRAALSAAGELGVNLELVRGP